MSKASRLSRLLTHFHLCATEPHCAIVLSKTEFEFLIFALSDFKKAYTVDCDDKFLTDKELDIVDSLSYYLADSYTNYIR